MNTNKEEQIRMLYEEAVYFHLVHAGCKIHRETIHIRSGDEF